MVKTAQAKGEMLERTKAEMEKVISKKEEELACLARADFRLSCELIILWLEHKCLKAQEEDLRSQVAELDTRNWEAQKVLDHLRVELQKQVEEKEGNTRCYQTVVEGLLQQMEDLRRKLEKATEERDEVEKVKGKKEDEIFGLQERVAQLNSEIEALRELSSDQAREELLREEKNGVVERLGEHTHKAEALMLELRKLEKTKRTVEQELGILRAANTQLLAEKEKRRRLEDTQKEAKAIQLLKEVLSMSKGTAAEMEKIKQELLMERASARWACISSALGWAAVAAIFSLMKSLCSC